MEIKVLSSNKEVVNSGVVFVNYGEKAEFIIKELNFCLSFEVDDKQNPYVNYRVEEEENKKYMSIKCYNFNGSLLYRLNQPIVLAQIEGKPLTLQFSVSSLNKRSEDGVEKEDMMLIYSWCLEK